VGEFSLIGLLIRRDSEVDESNQLKRRKEVRDGRMWKGRIQLILVKIAQRFRNHSEARKADATRRARS